MQFRIRAVDMNGYCGRERHPHESDVGLVVTPVRMEAIYFGPTEIVSLIQDDGTFFQPALTYLRGDLEGDGTRGIETCYTCVTMDGRLLDLMDHELEPLGAVVPLGGENV